MGSNKTSVFFVSQFILYLYSKGNVTKWERKKEKNKFIVLTFYNYRVISSDSIYISLYFLNVILLHFLNSFLGLKPNKSCDRRSTRP